MLDITAHCPLATVLAHRMRDDRIDLTRRWLERIVDRVAIEPNRVFPTDELLDHVPLLIVGIADYLEDPSKVIAADMPVVAKAMELGALRYAQHFDEYELLKEYEIFGGILFNFLVRTVDKLEESCTRAELLVCAHRMFHAIALIQQASITHYLRLMKAQVKEREERLRGFNRALTHELKNQIGAAMGAAQILEIDGIAEETRKQLVGVVLRNITSMKGVLENLTELSRLDGDSRQQRFVTLPNALAEVYRELRDAARSRGVELRRGDLPAVAVSAAAVELCLMNYVSNAIKYSDSSKPLRWVEVRAGLREGAEGTCDMVVEVSDNGLGVPEPLRAQLFERYFRAHTGTVTGVEGTGLGLSIVHDAVAALGGSAWAEFPSEGSVFAFSLPCRRAADAVATKGSRSAIGDGQSAIGDSR